MIVRGDLWMRLVRDAALQRRSVFSRAREKVRAIWEGSECVQFKVIILNCISYGNIKQWLVCARARVCVGGRVPELRKVEQMLKAFGFFLTGLKEGSDSALHHQALQCDSQNITSCPIFLSFDCGNRCEL